MHNVEYWWALLSLISVFNIIAWLFSCVLLLRNRDRYPPVIFNNRLLIAGLSSLYVLVCALRSLLPRIDLERIVLVDHWLSNVFLGRSLATVAELFFIAQCALLLREAGTTTGNRFVINLAFSLITVIVIAEGFSWYASLTTNYLASVFEESLWAVAALIMISATLSLMPATERRQRLLLVVVISLAMTYFLFMLLFDVPMYWQRYLLDSAADKTYLSLSQGLRDMVTNYRVSFEWDIWRKEVPWMSLYFTVAVWLSIYLPHAPVISPKRQINPRLSP